MASEPALEAPSAVAAPPLLGMLEGRVLGVLVEKQHTVPDTYPLSLNALLAGCNQKTSRDPVLEATESEVLAALEGLRIQALIIESSGSRVTRYAHNAERGLHLPSQAVAIMTTLLLRGPQTVAELRANCERLHRFADTSAVEAFLAELALRPAGGLVLELPRQPGTRETRWAQTLTGRPAMAPGRPEPAMSPKLAGGTEGANLLERVERLERELAALREIIAGMAASSTGPTGTPSHE